jgi:hypothetical protein
LRLDVAEAEGATISSNLVGALRSLGVGVALADVGVAALPLDALARDPFDALHLQPEVLGVSSLLRATTAVASALGLSVTTTEGNVLGVEDIANMRVQKQVAVRAA